MESLVLAAAVVMLSILTINVLALTLAYFDFRVLAALCGAVCVVTGIWLKVTLPHTTILPAISIAIGGASMSKLLFAGPKLRDLGP